MSLETKCIIIELEEEECESIKEECGNETYGVAEALHVEEEAKAFGNQNIYSTYGKKGTELLCIKEEVDKEIHSVYLKVEEIPVKKKAKEACEDKEIYGSYVKKKTELMHVKEDTNEGFQGICIKKEAQEVPINEEAWEEENVISVKEDLEAVYMKTEEDNNDLYADQFKEKSLHWPHVVSSQDNRVKSRIWGWACSVKLERLLVDVERRTCRLGRRIYKLHTAEPSQHIFTNTSSNVTQYQCKHCSKGFGNKSALAKHEHIHSTSAPEKAMKLYSCNHCSYSTKSKGNLRCHKKLHSGDKLFKCNHCDFKCVTNSKLKSHLRIHTGEKPFKCSYCNYTSAHTTNLRQHEKTHKKEEPFQCNHCQLKFARKDHLRNHELVHTDERAFKCDNCDYKAKRKADLRVHQRVHTGERPFKCRHCNNVFAYKKNLKIHLKSRHSDEQLSQ